MFSKEKIKSYLKFLKSPIFIFFSIGLAILLGILGSKGNINTIAGERNFFDWVNIIVSFCSPFGGIYLNLLKMTVYPILIAAIVSSIAGLVKSPHLGKILSRMLLCFIAMLILTSILGTLAGVIGKPGANLSEEARATLGKSIEKSEYKVDMEISLSEEQKKSKDKIDFIDFFVNIVPENVFRSLTDEMALQLVFFSILFGIAIGMIHGNKSDFITTLFEGLFNAFQKIINWLMYLLPFGLIFLLAGQIASSQKFFEVLIAMVKFIAIFYIVGLIALVINTIIIWKRSKEKLWIVCKELLDPIIIALATRSSFATLPSAIKALSQRLRFFESTTKLYVPLGITLGRFGNVIYFALAALFVSQLYAVPMTLGGVLIVMVASIFAGVATAGATGLATLSLMSIVLAPLGLPVEAVLILFMTIDTIVDPMRTLLIVHTNMAVNALIAEKAILGEDRREEIRGNEDSLPGNTFIEEIRGKGKVTVAIRKDDFPLFHYKNDDGQINGIDIKLAEIVAEEFGLPLHVNSNAETEDDLVRLLDTGKADFALSRISINSKIADKAAFSNPYISFHKAILVNHEKARDKNIKELIAEYNGKIGIEEQLSFNWHVEKIFPHAYVVKFHDYTELSKAVADGKILYAFGNEVDFRWEIKRNAGIKQKTSIAVLRNTEDAYVIAIAAKNRSFLYLYNNILKDEPNLTAEQFILKYGDV